MIGGIDIMRMAFAQDACLVNSFFFPEEYGNSAGASMAAYGCSNIINFYFTVQFGKALFDLLGNFLGIFQTCRMAHVTFTGVIQTAIS